MSYAAPGITNIISEPRNQMDMEVEHRLAGESLKGHSHGQMADPTELKALADQIAAKIS